MGLSLVSGDLRRSHYTQRHKIIFPEESSRSLVQVIPSHLGPLKLLGRFISQVPRPFTTGTLVSGTEKCLCTNYNSLMELLVSDGYTSLISDVQPRLPASETNEHLYH